MSFIKRTPIVVKEGITLEVSREFSAALTQFNQDIETLKTSLNEGEEVIPIDDVFEKKLVAGFSEYVNKMREDDVPFNPAVTEFVAKHSRSPRKTKKEKEIELLEGKINGAQKRVTTLESELATEPAFEKQAALQKQLNAKSTALNKLQEKLRKLK